MHRLAVLALAACASTPRSPTMPTDANKQTIRALYEDGINAGHLDAIAAVVSPAYVGPTGERGPAGFVANINDLRAGFPDIHFTIDDLVAEADRVVVRWSWRATHTGPFRGLAPTGKPVTNSGIAIYQLAAGQILHNWLETDRLGALQQLGALPPPPTSGARRGT
jgi:predicted ester cyclase